MLAAIPTINTIRAAKPPYRWPRMGLCVHNLRRTVGTRTYRGRLRPAGGVALVIVQLAVCLKAQSCLGYAHFSAKT